GNGGVAPQGLPSSGHCPWVRHSSPWAAESPRWVPVYQFCRAPAEQTVGASLPRGGPVLAQWAGVRTSHRVLCPARGALVCTVVVEPAPGRRGARRSVLRDCDRDRDVAVHRPQLPHRTALAHGCHGIDLGGPPQCLPVVSTSYGRRGSTLRRDP